MLFPRPPYRLHASDSRRPATIAAVGLGCALVLALLSILGVRLLLAPLREDQALWARGVLATDAGYEGTKTTENALDTFDLQVRYVDASGVHHRGRTRFDSTFYDIPRDAAPEVRYDPANPDSFVLSFAIDAATGRTAYAGMVGGLPLGLAAAMVLWAARRQQVRARRMRQCARDGRPVVLDLVFPRPIVLRNKKARYDYRRTNRDGSALRAFADFDPGHGPLFVGGRRGPVQILALQSSTDPEAVIVLREDLRPLDVPEDEAQRIATEAYEATEGAYR